MMRRQLSKSLIAALIALTCCCFVAGVVGTIVCLGALRELATLPTIDRLLVQFVGLGGVGIPFGLALGSFLLAYRSKAENVDYVFGRFLILVIVSLCLLTPMAPVALYCAIQLRKNWDTFSD